MRPAGHSVVVCTLVFCVFAFMSFGSSPRAQGIVIPGSGTIVLLTSAVPRGDIHGDWLRITDTTAAGGAALQNPNRSRAKITPALAAPASYFEMRFDASSGGPYHLWIRMRAQNDATGNDSVHVQFSDSLDSAGRAVSRIGSSQSAEVVLQNGPGGTTPQAWGWADNGWGAAGAPIYFRASGAHVLRIQQREDGAIIDQVVLSRDTFASRPPGGRLNDRTILRATSSASATASAPQSAAGTVVIWAAKVSDDHVFGAWRRIADTTAAGGAALQNRNAGISKIAPALARPGSYFETTFTAAAHKAYHVWVHMRAEGNSTGNDSVHLQFNDSLNPSGAPFARIGTSSSAEFVLQAGSSGAAPHGWGWTENGWNAYGPHVFFASSSTHTVRVQQREDGAIIDQIVISPDAYLTTAPGARRDDLKILPATATPVPSAPAPAAPAPPPPSSGATSPSGGTSSGSGTSTATTPRTWTVMFTPPPDHATNVTSYLLEVFAAGVNPATAVPKATNNLGKPALNANGEVSIDRTSFINALPTGSYVATVSAIATGRKDRSAVYAFTR